MPFDQTRVGKLAAELMDDLDQRYGEGDIGAMLLIVEAMPEGPGGRSEVVSKASDGRDHINLGLLEIAKLSISEGPVSG